MTKNNQSKHGTEGKTTVKNFYATYARQVFPRAITKGTVHVWRNGLAWAELPIPLNRTLSTHRRIYALRKRGTVLFVMLMSRINRLEWSGSTTHGG